MHAKAYEKSPKFRACWHAWRFANVTDVLFFDALMPLLGQLCPTHGPAESLALPVRFSL